MKRTLIIFVSFLFFVSFQVYAKGSGEWLRGTRESHVSGEFTVNLQGLQPPRETTCPDPRSCLNSNNPTGKSCSCPPHVGGPGPLPVPSYSSRMIVNSEINNIPNGTLTSLNYFISRSFTLRIDDQNRSTNYEAAEGGRLLIHESEQVSQPWVFSNNTEGKYRDHERNRHFLISFSSNDREATLKFSKNAQLNCFVLDTIIIDNAPYPIRNVGGDPIHLLVLGEDRRNTVIPAGVASSQDRDTPLPDNRNERSLSTRTRNIISSGIVNTEGVIRYVRSRTRNSIYTETEIRNIINTYIREAAREGVNHDFAIAQMLHVTDFFREEKIKNSNNYAGLNKEGTRWSGNFSNMERGVKAHIQHLRIYSQASLRNPQELVNPRHELIVNRDRIETFDQLYYRWSPHYSERYARDINAILEGLYSCSER